MKDNIGKVKNVGVFLSFLTFSALSSMIFSPIVVTNASISTDALINASVYDILSLSLDTNDLQVSASHNQFSSGTVNAAISTNSTYGYTLTLEDSDDNTNMVGDETEDVIVSDMMKMKTSETMENDRWGYSIDGTNYRAIPMVNFPKVIKYNPDKMETESETASVTFGFKIGSTIDATTYRDSVKFTLYVNGADKKPYNPDGPNIPDPTDPDPDYDPEEPQDPDDPIIQKLDCSTLATEQVITVKDYRDGNTYRVSKLKDGRCWMLDNLRIEGKVLNSKTSDLSNGRTYTVVPSAFANFTTQNNDAAVVDETYGGYYSFYTATAGTGGTDFISGNAPDSICPKGWKLPSGYDDGEYITLYNEYNSPALMRNKPKFVYGGWADNGHYIRIADQGSYGAYWTSTTKNSTQAYYMFINNSKVSSALDNMKYYGFSVRCVQR